MKKNRFIILLGVLLMAAHVKSQTINELRWENRVFLVFAPHPADPHLKQQLSFLTAEKENVMDRDLVIFQIWPEGGLSPGKEDLTEKEAADLYQQFRIAKNDFAILLIGKDGSEKLRKYEPTPGSAFFDLIDTMPMRRSEMRRN